MRIAFVTETWLPSTDGIVTRLRATIGELRRQGHQVLLIAPTTDEMPSPAGITVVTVPTVQVRFIYGGHPWGWPVPAVGKALTDFRPDVVHVVSPVFLGIAGVLAAHWRGYPLVASYHTNVATYAAYYHLGWAQPVIRGVTRALHRRAQVNLATSADGQAALHALGIPDALLWSRGVDTDLFHPDRAGPHTRARLLKGHPDAEVLAVYVGRLGKEKSLQDLKPLTRQPGTHLLLVGDGPDRARLEHLFGGRSATFTGYLHGVALAQAYAAADVFVFPSRTETLGLVLLEALASGLPVVAADTPASREALADCEAVRLFDPSAPDTIPSLVKDLTTGPDGATRREQARAAVSTLGWSAATSNLVEHYHTSMTRAEWPICR